jgi:hypothetical protein
LTMLIPSDIQHSLGASRRIYGVEATPFYSCSLREH